MAASLWKRGRALWDEDEWFHIVLFLGIWAFLATGAIYKAITTGNWGLTTFGYDLMITFIWATFLMGMFFVRMFWRTGIVSFRRMWRATVRYSLIFGLIFVVLILMSMIYAPEIDPEGEEVDIPEGGEFVAMLVFIYIGGYITGIVMVLVGYILCMGLVGMIYLFTVGFAPPFLRRVRNLTHGDRWYGRVMEWLFLIPDNLDTSTLHATSPVEEHSFPWQRFRMAVGWQAIFALLIAILVSLNPFLLKVVSLDTLFEIMNNAHIIVPMLFLPILVMLRLRVSIKGPIKDFSLYIGIRTRLVRTFLAIGTLLLFIRLALEDVDPEQLLFRLVGYTTISVIMVSTFTWLYFNFVENQLAFKVVDRAPWLVEGERAVDEDDGDGEEDLPEEMSDPVPTGT